MWRAVSPGRVHRPYCLDGAGEGATSSTLFRTDGILAVARDLFDDRVPVTAAREIYGVVVGHDRQLVLDATDARRRSAIR